MSGNPRHFLVNICTDRNCAQHMWPQAEWSNPLSGSIICVSVGLLWVFYLYSIFLIQEMITITINITSVGSIFLWVYPHNGVWRSPVWSNWAYVSVFLSLHISIYLCLSFYISVWSSALLFGEYSDRPELWAAHATAGHVVKSAKWQYNISIRISVRSCAGLLKFLHFIQ